MSNEEWGNIELPGMTDEELHSKNWNRVDTMKQKWANPKTRERLIAYTKVPGYGKMVSERNKKVAQRPEIKKMAKQKGKEYSKKYKEDSEFRKKHIESVNKRSQTKEWQATCKKNKIQTPDGVFESRNAAAEYYNVKPPVLNYRMKRYPDEYYYIEITNGSTGYKDRNSNQPK